jgi:hypothetical protein
MEDSEGRRGRGSIAQASFGWQQTHLDGSRLRVTVGTIAAPTRFRPLARRVTLTNQWGMDNLDSTASGPSKVGLPLSVASLRCGNWGILPSGSLGAYPARPLPAWQGGPGRAGRLGRRARREAAGEGVAPGPRCGLRLRTRAPQIAGPLAVARRGSASGR